MAFQTTASSFALTAFMPEWGISIEGGETCLPPELSQYTSSYAKTKHYLGPFKCPGNWTEATTRVFSGSFTQTFCCPSGYGKLLNQGDYATIWGTCISSVNIYDDFTWAYREDDSWTVTTNGSHPTATAKRETVSYRTVIANPYVMGYNTAPLTGTAVAKTSDSDQFKSGLSAKARAGIGAGVSLGVIVILALMGLVYFLGRRRKKAPNVEVTGKSAENSGHPQELSGGEPSELDLKDGQAPTPQELQSRGDAPELQGNGELRQELEGVSVQPPVELEINNSDDQVNTKSHHGVKSHSEIRGGMSRQMYEDNEREARKGNTQE